MLRRKRWWITLVFLLGAVSVLGGRLSRAYANITLVSFTAQSLVGLPEVYVEWETATEIDTAGFYVQRSLTNEANSYTRVSDFTPNDGDSITGATYDWIDETTTLNTTYYYRLEEIPSDAAQSSITYDPVSVIAGLAPTDAPPAVATATRTPIATLTRTPTLTLTPRPGTTSTNTPVRTNPPAATPRPATGATVTPRPATGNVDVPPTSASVATQVPGAPTEAPQSPLPATPLPGSEPSAPPQATPAQASGQTTLPNAVAVAPGAVAPGAAAPALAPTLAVPEVVGPVVVVTEATTAPATKPAEARNGGLLLIMGAAVFLLAGAFLLLRQASK
jgi:hypothetical protein